MVGQSGLEPPTSRLSVVCSNQLSYWPIGGDERNRTADPLLARQVLSQLSYTPVTKAIITEARHKVNGCLALVCGGLYLWEEGLLAISFRRLYNSSNSAGKKKKRKKQIFCKKVVDFCGALRYTDEVACEGDNLKGKPNEGA